MEAEAQTVDTDRSHRRRVVNRFIVGFYAAFIIFAATGAIVGAAHGDVLVGLILGLAALTALLLGGLLVGSTAFGLSTLWRTGRTKR